MSAERLYPIAPPLASSGDWVEGLGYCSGVTPTGEQVILRGGPRTMHAFRFDAEGHYLGRLDRDRAAAPGPGQPGGPPPGRRADDLLAWADELGLRPAMIRVRKFHSEHDGPSLYIDDYPVHFEDEGWDSDEEFAERFAWWLERGAFVLCWHGKEHWIDREGQEFG
jgi:hypothetical protein